MVTELKVENPYVGPRPFEERHQRRFFGRDWEADELVSLVVAHPAVLLYAQSGAGKTSLINARLIPLLRDDEGLEVLPVARVRGEVPEEVQHERIENLFVFNTLLGWMESGPDPAQLVDLSLSAFLKGLLRPKDEEGQPTVRVVIFDQFEELFTLYPERWTEREGFFAQVADALSEDPFLRVLFVLREDYLAQLDPYVALLPERLRTRFRLERLRQEAALAAVKGPLMDTERSFAPGVAESLVEELLKIRVETRVGEIVEVSGEFVEPVQLQVVCRSLWEELSPEITEITLEHLRIFGDVDQALLGFYERALGSTVRQTAVREGRLRVWFERDLITLMGTRGTVYRGAESTGGVPNAAIDVLDGQHLIRAERRAGARWYELTHDRFIGPIQRSNEAWRAARRERWLRIGRGVAAVLVLLFLGIMALQAIISLDLMKEVVEAQATATVAAQGAGTAVAQVEATATAALAPEVQATADFHVWQTAQAQATAASHDLETVQAQATSTRLAAATPEPGVTETPPLDPTAIAAVETATAAAESLQIAQQKVSVAAAELKATATAAAAAPPMEDVTSRLSRHPVKRFERRTLDQIKYLIIQHSALPGDFPPERIANYLVERQQWPGIGYHFYITSDGTIYLTNDPETVCCFTGADGEYDPLGVCICFAGNFTDEVPTAAQLSSGGKLLAFLMQELALQMESIRGAKEFWVTQSPGNQWDSGQKWKDMLLAQVKAAQGAGLAGIEEALALVRDRDGDGIPDVEDACPDEPGSSLTGGCPEPTPTKADLQPLTGNELIQITEHSADEYVPSFSPDQRTLLLMSNHTGDWQIFTLNPDGSNWKRLTEDGNDYHHARFSPDGKRIIFSSDISGDFEIYTMATDGTDLRRLTYSDGSDTYPSYSLNGQRIVFMSKRNGATGVYIMNADGSGQRAVIDTDATEAYPYISPDGQSVVFQSDVSGNYEIYLISIDGGEPRQLTNNPARDADPVFSPDGRSIAFETNRDGDYEIYVMDSDGSNQRNLTNFPSGNDQVPSISPDGLWVVFQSDRNGSWDIFRIPLPK